MPKENKFKLGDLLSKLNPLDIMDKIPVLTEGVNAFANLIEQRKKPGWDTDFKAVKKIGKRAENIAKKLDRKKKVSPTQAKVMSLEVDVLLDLLESFKSYDDE